jgi:mono/diheme cytochrome c family protein
LQLRVRLKSDAGAAMGWGDPVTMSVTAKRYFALITVAGLVLTVCGSSAFAASVARGKQLARRLCSVCHVVDAGQSAGVPPAPAFRSIAKSRQFRAKGAKLLWEAHGTMPNFALTGDEADDVAAYIRSLAK